jgi:hypothetical protein
MFGDLIYVYFCKNTTLELLLYKMLVNTPAGSPGIVRSMSLQRLHDSAATSGRSDRNDRTIQTHRLHVETAPSVNGKKNRRTSRIACNRVGGKH